MSDDSETEALVKQARRLETACSIIQSTHTSLSLDTMVTEIVDNLVDVGGFSGAAISLDADLDTVTLRHAASAGQIGSDPALTQSTPISARGVEIGTLTTYCESPELVDDLSEQLDFVLPTLLLGFQHAIAFEEVQNYRRTLEQRVDERTRELREARDQLTSTVEELREAQGARQKFFGNISHEIRTPLSLIMLAAADIERRSGHVLDERARGGLTSVNESARKLVRLVDELLLLAAGQEDKLVLSREPTDLAALVAQIVLAWRPAAEAAGLVLEGNAPPQLIANVDPVAVERIASNLVSNAVKYTPRGGQVTLELATDADRVRLSVLDTGPGIDADLAGRLFGRFERAGGEDRRKVGTGIGLSLVKQLVEAHQGTVEAFKRESGGTEFRVTFPASVTASNPTAVGPTALRTNHAPAADSTSIKSGTVFRPPGLSGGTILVAEDQPQLAESIATLLSEHYTVIIALDGFAALELVKQHQPQLLITDVEMPGMMGIELSTAFRETVGDKVAPIIILSAIIDLRTRVAGLEAGAVDYVTKPFDPSELRARVQAQFRMRDLAMRLHRAEQLTSMGILTSGLAHELRNPANGIINAIAPLTELLPQDLIGPETDAGQLLDAMRSSADQIAFLVRQLLGFRNNAAIELRPADGPGLVQRAVVLAKEACTGIEVRIAVDVRKVLCAAPLLVQVLANLIENAAHAAGRGGWVEIRGSSEGGRTYLEVSDSGPGVPVELRERVFEPFFTTKSPGKGTGLGLSVARAIVHRHRGTLEVREREGRTAFVVDLPAESILAAAKANAV